MKIAGSRAGSVPKCHRSATLLAQSLESIQRRLFLPFFSVTWPHLDCPESGGVPSRHQVELEPGARVRLRQPALQVAPVNVDAAQEGLRTLAPAPHVQDSQVIAGYSNISDPYFFFDNNKAKTTAKPCFFF